MWFFKRKNEELNAPTTVAEAISGLQTALDNLSAVQETKRAEHQTYSQQVVLIQAKADAAKVEEEKAGRIYKNIAELLK